MISVLYTIILITNFKLIEMCIKSSPSREGSSLTPNPLQEERGDENTTKMVVKEDKGLTVGQV